MADPSLAQSHGLRDWIRERWKPIVVVFVVGVAAVSLAYGFGGQLVGLPVTIVVSFISLIGAYLSQQLLARNQRTQAIDAENRRQQIEIELRIRDRKAEVYGRFITSWMRLFLSPEFELARTSGDREAVTKEMLSFGPDLMLWGSNEVVKAYADMRSALNSTSPSTEVGGLQGTVEMGRLMLAMRTEMGHQQHVIDEHTLLEHFITDWRTTGRSRLDQQLALNLEQ